MGRRLLETFEWNEVDRLAVVRERLVRGVECYLRLLGPASELEGRHQSLDFLCAFPDVHRVEGRLVRPGVLRRVLPQARSAAQETPERFDEVHVVVLPPA